MRCWNGGAGGVVQAVGAWFGAARGDEMLGVGGERKASWTRGGSLRLRGWYWGIETREKGEGMGKEKVWMRCAVAAVWLVGALVLNRKISLE